MFDAISGSIRGFYQHHTSSQNSGGTSFCFAIRTYTYSVVWTYCTRSQTTTGVFVSRSEACLSTSVDSDLATWCKMLEFQTNIARHPLCLLVVSAMHIWHKTGRKTSNCLARVLQLEAKTGFNP
jgi:hypothetical protein